MIFKDNKHAQQWEEAVSAAGAVRDDGTIKGDFGASLYILTGLPGVYSRAQQHIHPGYIDFEPMLNAGLSTGEHILVALAANLYNGSYFDRFTPIDIVSYCDADGVELATQALRLRKQRLDIGIVRE